MKNLLLLPILLAIGCSSLRDAGVPLPEMEATETGIATGVVLGAGVGALVGSTSGQAGVGALVGGVAGGATGGVVGKAFETQEERLAAHDKKLGIDTKPTSGASMKSRIWASADTGEFVGNGASGTKGVASQYQFSKRPAGKEIQVERIPVDPSSLSGTSTVNNSRNVRQIQREPHRVSSSSSSVSAQRITSTPIYTESSKSSEFASLPPARGAVHKVEAPKIELQKSGGEFPTSANLPPVRKPSLDGSSRVASSDASFIPPARSSVNAAQVAPKRIELTAPAKTAVARNSKEETQKLAAQKVNQQAEQKKEAQRLAAAQQQAKLHEAREKERKTQELARQQARARMAEPAKGVAEAKQQITAASTESSQVNTTAQASATVSNAAKKTVSKASTATACEKGKNEFSRASSAGSDSDKVFYLRRAIMACPEEPSLRVELGKVYSRLGLKDDARKEFSKALDFDPSNESAQDELSIMMLDSHARN